MPRGVVRHGPARSANELLCEPRPDEIAALFLLDKFDDVATAALLMIVPEPCLGAREPQDQRALAAPAQIPRCRAIETMAELPNGLPRVVRVPRPMHYSGFTSYVSHGAIEDCQLEHQRDG